MTCPTTFPELLCLAGNPSHLQQQNLCFIMAQAELETHQLVKNFTCLYELALKSDKVAATLTQYLYIRSLVSSYEDLVKLAGAPETLNSLLNYPDIRKHIQDFKQLKELLILVDLLRITLPVYKDIRALVTTPEHLTALTEIRLSRHFNSNLAELFLGYPEIRQIFTSLSELLTFFKQSPNSCRFFIKDAFVGKILKNTQERNKLITAISRINAAWGEQISENLK